MSTEDWENGTLGQEEAYAEVADKLDDAEIDDCLGLEFIPLRLPTSEIDVIRLISESEGVSVNALIRRAISSFVEDNKK